MARRHALTIVLDEDHDARLTRLAERSSLDRGDLARSLLASALDSAETDGKELTDLLDGIPGAWERAELGPAQGLSGDTVPLDAL